ncbi:SprT family protein [Periweissella fabalis]|uniref:SprT family protein n=1 Tax=Periweissella fabalis TaxID=1070421 RepID=A0A7X6N388_9LACO|nr:SprT family protein [Periweissella fabalis]MCM0599617.1 SprT family protein [Periweissella fabalis]NKZ23922.1 SprT family protein [Periweissella fabalis]
MTNEELQALVEVISLHHFNEPFLHHVTFNARLQTTGGRYRLQDHNIDINPKMLTEHDMVTLVGVIKHELVHYHLHLSGQPYQHGSPTFKQLLKQVGGLRFAPRNAVNAKVYKYHYTCQKCAMDYYRQRQINLKKYVCGQCQGKLQLIAI